MASDDGAARPIEEAAQDFLSKNRAPREIEADWNEWIDRNGSQV